MRLFSRSTFAEHDECAGHVVYVHIQISSVGAWMNSDKQYDLRSLHEQGFTGDRDDRRHHQHIKDAPDSQFKLKTGELIKQDVRKAALRVLSQNDIFAKQESREMLGKSSKPQVSSENAFSEKCVSLYSLSHGSASFTHLSNSIPLSRAQR